MSHGCHNLNSGFRLFAGMTVGFFIGLLPHSPGNVRRFRLATRTDLDRAVDVKSAGQPAAPEPTASPLAQAGHNRDRIVPGRAPARAADEESAHVWGFRDSAFQVLPNGSVRLTGSRYPLSGHELPDLLPWTRKVLGVDFAHDDGQASSYPPDVPPPREHPAFLREVRALLGERSISTDPIVRLRHGHGHTLEEMYAIKHERLRRVPDLVVYPEEEQDVSALVDAAVRHDVCLVPYGGGTNVTEALRCPLDEERTIVAVDMSRLDRILWIDPTNLMACIQAGAVGRHIQTQLAEYGFTLGHEPDSVEFSTLGGWVATYASGMKKNRYGNIEELVLDVHVVTPRGALTRAAVAPRESVGVDPRRWVFGSEGTLGIVSRAIVKIYSLPAVQRYDALLFPTFEAGLAFLYELMRQGALPASVRLVDNDQFQMSQTLRPQARGWSLLRRRAEKLYVTRLRGFDPERMAACTLLYEGTRAEVAAQEASVRRIARRHGALHAGEDAGRRGYWLTFSIAYLRDFAMNIYILGESLETSVPWSEALALCTNVKRRMADEHAARVLPGKPLVSCRVTQIYQTGVCIYFYIAFYHKGVERPAQVFAELERCARDEILRSGGSLSHHHGVGKLRQGFLPRIMSPAALEWAASVKRAVDPTNVFGIGNQAADGGAAEVAS
ncbi:MAG: FAD-binding oxidoreductase [Gemmatimonadetes bacterium]|nr:FAD-binding oxidoreductase [Gemmatimonadota bacterium]